jgi:hypothetical protein
MAKLCENILSILDELVGFMIGGIELQSVKAAFERRRIAIDTLHNAIDESNIDICLDRTLFVSWQNTV